MRSFIAIDQLLADPPSPIAALLVELEERRAHVQRLGADRLGAAEIGPETKAALSAIGRGPLGVRGILQAHRALLRREATPVPVDAQAGMLLNELVARYELSISRDRQPRLLLLCAFGLDFVTIGPFEEGNGRLGRLLLTRELLRDGHEVARFVSLDVATEATRQARDAALLASLAGWHTSEHVLWPWAGWLLGRVADAYDEVERRMAQRGELSGD